jgi:hypothetical protein
MDGRKVHENQTEIGDDFMWRKVNGASESAFRKMIASSTMSVYSSDIGKLVFESSGRARFVTIGTSTGSTDGLGSTVGGLVGICAYMPANATADTSTIVYVDPLTPFDMVEGKYSTASTDGAGAMASDWIKSTNLGLVFKFIGQECSSGSTYASTSGSTWVLDWITASTASVRGSSLGVLQMTDFSTQNKTVRGFFLPELFTGITQSTG